MSGITTLIIIGAGMAGVLCGVTLLAHIYNCLLYTSDAADD